MLDVYAAREDPEPGVTGRLVADAVPGGGARYVPDFADVPAVVAALARPGDLVLTMGAGDITKMGPLVLDEIAASGGWPRHDRRSARQRSGPRHDHGRGPRGGAAAPGGHVAASRGGRGSSRWRRSPSSPGWPGCSSATGCSWCGRSRWPAPPSRPRPSSRAADVPLGTPLSRVNAGAVTRRVESIRQVASATVSVDWPDHLTIAVTERVPVMAVRMAGGGYDLIDPSGVIVLFANAKPAGLPLFSTLLSGGALRGDPGVSAVSAVLAELAPSLAPTVPQRVGGPLPTGSGAGSSVQSQQVTLSMTGGKTIVWGDPSNAAAKNRELEILLRNGARYVNVSAPGTAVTR